MKRHSEKGMALVITLMMLAIVTFMAVVFLALSRRERSNVKIYEEQNTARAMADAALARSEGEIVARMNNGAETWLTNSPLTAAAGFGTGQLGLLSNVQHIATANGQIQRARFHYDLVSSRNYQNPNGYAPGGGFDAANVNYGYEKNKGEIPPDKIDFLQNIANLQYDPRPPVYVTVTNPRTGRSEREFRFYLDLNRNGLYDSNGWAVVTGANNERYNPNGTILRGNGTALQTRFSGDPEWVGVLERPDLPHSESNRFIGRYAYIVLPQGKSLDMNYIHNQAVYPGSDTNLSYGGPNSQRRFFRNQGVGSWELNFAAFLVDLNTNFWRPDPNVWYRYTPTTAEGIVFQNASAALSYRLNTRDNLKSAFGALTNQTPFGPAPLQWETDFVDYMSDGPLVHFDQWVTNSRPLSIPSGNPLLRDNDLPNRYWHGAEKVDKTAEYPDIQRYFSLAGGNINDFRTRLTNSMSSARTNTFSRYSYYRLLAQMGNDSPPTLRGRIHLNFTNEPGTLSTNLSPWFTPFGPAMIPRAPIMVTNQEGVLNPQINTLTNFFLIAADAMLRASLVTNVFLDDFGRWRTNYTVGGSYYSDPALNARPDQPRKAVNLPVRPDISVTNIQVYHSLNGLAPTRDHQYVTNSEYTAALHRVFQLAANIYDNMTNRSNRAGSSEPYFPTVFRPLFNLTPTNITIVGWTNQENANFAARTNNWVQAREFFIPNRPVRDITDVNIFGQPWVIGAKKGWPSFNEFSIESFVQVTRKLGVFKSPTSNMVSTNFADLGAHLQQIYMMGISNTFGIEAWNSYSKLLRRQIRLETEVQSDFGIINFQNRTNNQFTFATPTLFSAINAGPSYTINALPGWAGREPNDTPFPLAVSTNANGMVIDGQRINSDYRVPIYGMVRVLPDSEYDQARGFFAKPAAFTDLKSVPDLRLVMTNRIRYVAIDITDPNDARVVDFVSLDNLITLVDMKDLMHGNTNAAVDLALGTAGLEVFNPSQLWDTTVIDAPSGLTRGMFKQIQISRGDFPQGFGEKQWKAYSSAQSKFSETNNFRHFMEGDPVDRNADKPWQAPYAPTRRFYLQSRFQANDPLVHYNKTDLIDPFAVQQFEPITPSQSITNKELGRINASRLKIRDRYSGWEFQDPDMGARSDNWKFPIARLDNTNNAAAIYGIPNFHYRYPNLGALGQIHRGTPWQTIYMKAAAANNMIPGNDVTKDSDWAVWSGSYGTHPTNDWRLVGLFTAAISENAVRGLLSVNQTNMAAWSAALSGIQVITNSTPDNVMQSSQFTARARFGDPRDNYSDLLIQPGSVQLSNIVRSINAYRAQRPLGVFGYMGEVLGAPLLSTASPYLHISTNQPLYAFPDDALEAIPRRVLSLLKEDEPRMVVYCFGQTLKPAPRSFATDPDFYNLCLNYQVTGEYANKAVLRVEGELKNPANPLRTVVESFEALPPFD